MAIRLLVGAAVPTESCPSRLVEKVADTVAQEKKAFVLHPRYGYQTTGEYPKHSYTFPVGQAGEWPLADRAKGQIAALETNVLAMAAREPFTLCIGHDATFSSVPDGALHRITFDKSGLLLTRIAPHIPLVFEGLAPGDVVQVTVEQYPTYMLLSDGHLRAADGRVTSDTTWEFAVDGQRFTYERGTVVADTASAPGLPSWLEFLPVVTDEEKADIAAAAGLAIRPEWTTGQVAEALVQARTGAERPNGSYILDAKTHMYKLAPSVRGLDGRYFTVHPDTGIFKTSDHGIKYAECLQVPGGTRVSIETTSILRQIQCEMWFTVNAGPGSVTAFTPRNVGGIYVVDFPSGLPATKLSPCTISWSKAVRENESQGTGGDAGDVDAVPPPPPPVHVVTFLCEAIGAPVSAQVHDLESLVVQAVSSRHVVVSHTPPRASSEAAAALTSGSRAVPPIARPTRAPAPAPAPARPKSTSATSAVTQPVPARKPAPTVAKVRST